MEAAVEIIRKLREAGHVAYLAGGCVRDGLRGVKPKDYDVATDARPEEVTALFRKTEPVGAHFGVVLVKETGSAVEVATFRSDGEYRDGRHPEAVVFTNAREDALRRDFTINGMFLDPLSGEVLDYVGGQDDLAAGVIRAIGDPDQRFREDSLRLMRAVRFATVTGFHIEETTWAAIRRNAALLDRVSAERVREEFSRILCSAGRERGVELLLRSGLLERFLPEYLALEGCEQPPQWHPEGDVYRHTQMMLGMLPAHASLELTLAVLLHDIGKPPVMTVDETGRIRFNGHDRVGADMAREILGRLKYPNRVISAVSDMVLRHMRFMNVQVMRRAKLREMMALPTFDDELELHRVDCLASNGMLDNYTFMQEKRNEFAHVPLIPEPLLNGRDLIALGLEPGRELGRLLERVKEAQLDGEITTREDALALVQRQLSSGQS